ncbi:TcpQ domain-containing protein [Pigmentiphaga aceris]|nr:TcpQ domain-containing protein [Pigmentiphaga aceris]
MLATFVFPRLRHVRTSVCILMSALAAAPIGTTYAAPNYDFSYRVSGDRRVAPQQVFDDGVSTYLQFYPGQVLPALIAIGSDGKQLLLKHVQLGPYVTVSGTYVGLVAQLGTVRSTIDYSGKAPRVAGENDGGLPAAMLPAPSSIAPSSIAPSSIAPSAVVATAAPVASPAPSMLAATPSWNAAPTATAVAPLVVNHSPLTAALPTAAPTPASSSASVVPVSTAPAVESSRDIKPVNASTDANVVSDNWPLAASTPPAKPFEATLADQNLRRALGRWAEQAGWTFRAEHWTPDVDIAVSAPAVFGGDFKRAVRALLAGTELSAKPLQPCFYANQVLRVVAQAERCDRRVAH